MKRRWIAALTAMMIMATAIVPQSVTVKAAEVVEETTMVGATTSAGVEKDSDADGVSDNGYVYQANGTTATITSYRGTATTLTVPLRIEVGTTTSGSGTTATTTTYDVTSIGSAAFAGNAGLKTVTMQGGTPASGSSSSSTTAAVGLQTIGDRAFFGCPSLTTVTIPATATVIGSQAFSDCPALTALNVTAGNQRYISNDGVLYEYVGYNAGVVGTYNTYTLMQYPSGKASTAFTVPASIASRLTSIGQGAFAGAQSLTSVTLPETIESLGVEAFRNCSALTSITIPSKLTSIPS